jgi:PhnB protein
MKVNIPAAPEGYSTVNPFIVTRDAEGLIAFVKEVFDGTEHPDARTIDTDGLLLHAELGIGGSTIMFGERKPNWPFTPSLLQVYVDDVEATLAAAERLGATIVTRPTAFYGDVFSRFLDPWKNLWWVYQHGGDGAASAEQDETDIGQDSWDDEAAGEEAWSAQATPELTYIHETLLATMPLLRE